MRLCILLACLLLAACTSANNASDQDRHDGFYGGLTGGMSHP